METKVAFGQQDCTSMLTPELVKATPDFVLRLLAGANVFNEPKLRPGIVSIQSGHAEYVVTDEAFRFIELVHQRIVAEEVKIHGMAPPFSVNDFIHLRSEAEKIAGAESQNDPKKIRLLWLRRGINGVSFYRCMQPCGFLVKTPLIEAEHTEHCSFFLAQQYDVIVTPRGCDMMTLGMLKHLHDAGKVLIYETDDLLSNIPSWNPASEFTSANPEEQMGRERLVEFCDHIITSTPELAKELKRPEVTTVCMNGINPEYWPCKIHEHAEGPVRILWGGSATHKADCDLLVKPIMSLLAKYGKQIEFIFVGYCPVAFMTNYEQPDGRIAPGIAPQYRDVVKFRDNKSVLTWAETLTSCQADIAVAPLAQHPFNESKSELKCLEAWALGIPIVCSRIAPYMRALGDDETGGFLVGDKPEDWVGALSLLIEDASLRTEMAAAGLKRLNERYIMSVIVDQYERAFLKIMHSKSNRKECWEAITARLVEKGWA